MNFATFCFAFFLALMLTLPAPAQTPPPPKKHHGMARRVGHGVKKAARGVRWVIW
jgi:hypothetical protein